MPSSAAAVEVRARAGRPRAQDADRHVGARMRERRIMLGLTQQQLAELVGITYQQANKYERGENRISAGRLHAVARVLGVEVGYFYGEAAGAAPAPGEKQRLLLELARGFVLLPRRQQEAVCELVRSFAEAAAPGPEEVEDRAGREAA